MKWKYIYKKAGMRPYYHPQGEGIVSACHESGCFDSVELNSKSIKAIQYFVPINFSYSRRKLTNFWIGFLRTFLKDMKWDVSINKTSTVATFSFDLTYRRKHDLLHLNAFRYLDCLPKLIEMLYKRSKGLTEDELFRAFYQLSLNVLMEKEKVDPHTLSNSRYRSLICPKKINGYDYGWGAGSSPTPISIRKIRANLKKAKASCVHTYFR